jgi:DNA-binding beta-propeller fold protein YncE
MLLRVFAAALFAAFLFGAARRPAPLTVYSAPAGVRVAGVSSERDTAGILPDGRIVSPIGATIFVGTNPQSVALSPDGRYAVVGNDDADTSISQRAGTQGLVSGYSLVVVDTARMRVTDVYSDAGATFYAGLAVVADPHNPAQTLVLASDGAHDVVRVFDLSYAGKLTPERAIALPVASSPGYGIDGRAFPSSIAISQDGRYAYVLETLGQIVATIDIGTRTLRDSAAVGLRPYGLAVADHHVYAADGGLAAYPVLSPPRSTPDFAAPDVDPQRSSSLAVVPLDDNGDVSTESDAVSFVRMDQPPDGVKEIGGIIPSGVAAREDGSYAYVTLANVDRVAIVGLRGETRVVNGLDLRLFPNAPYGTEPSAEVLARNGSRLYVALAGLNAVAVLDAHDPSKLHRLGLIPTGWYPSALALSRDERFLYVTDAEGLDGWGMLQRVDLRHLALGPATLAALRYNRKASYARPNSLVPPLRSLRRSDAIKHVVYVAVGVDSYDAVLGDLTDARGRAHGNGDAAYVLYGESATPNLHALARDFALADNIYGDRTPAVQMQLAMAATATLPVEREAPLQSARTPFNGYGEDPEEYPRSGYLFNSLLRAGESFRDYGGLEDVSGYRNGRYTLGIPVLAALAGNTDLAYRADSHVSDAALAAEFVRDFSALSQAGRVPDFAYVRIPSTPGGEAEGDRALGEIVDAISHSAQWGSTAIFVVPESVQLRRDHVEGSRIYAIVVSPYSRRGFVDDEHLSIASVVKTEEEILGLPPLTTGDLLATDLAPCFTSAPDAAAFQAAESSSKVP